MLPQLIRHSDRPDQIERVPPALRESHAPNANVLALTTASVLAGKKNKPKEVRPVLADMFEDDEPLAPLEATGPGYEFKAGDESLLDLAGF